MMNILISVNRDYLDKAETMLHSLRRNDSEDVTVYLINHSLDSVDLNKFEKYLRKSLRMNIEIINVSDTFFDHIPMNIKRFSVEIYYRVLAQFLLPLNVERIMWLDADIVLCGSIREFYYQSFENNLIVACPDTLCDDEEIVKIKENLGLPKEHIYFNSGVLLLNIEELRKKTNLDEILKATQSIAEYFTYPDQDLLNYLYSGKIKYCDRDRFNCQVIGYGKLTRAQVDNIVVLHYAGTHKPWLFYYLHELSKAAVPYFKEIALQGKWLSIIKEIVLYMAWLVYYKMGICNIVRKRMSKGK